MDAVETPALAERRAALVESYAAQAGRAIDGVKSLRHTMLRGPSAALRELGSVIASRQDDAGPWLAAVAQVGWLQGEPDAVTLERYRHLRAVYGVASLTELDLTAYLAAGGTQLSAEERAELHAHPALKATARASAASDAAADDHGVASSEHLATLTKILALPQGMTLTIRSGKPTGPAAITAKVSIINRARAAFRESEPALSPVAIVVAAGTAADLAVTSASLKQQSHPKVTIVTQGASESVPELIARAPGDLLVFLPAGSWAGPSFAADLASGYDQAEGALAVLPSAQWVDSALRFATANSLLRAADPSSALVHRSAFAAVGPLYDVPLDEALDEFITRLRRSTDAATTIGRVTKPTLIVHPERPRELTDAVIPTQDWRAAFRATTVDSGRAGGVVDPTALPLPFGVQRDPNRHFDVVFISSLSRAGWKGGSQESMLQEIRALSRQGLRLGLIHLEAPRIGGPGPGQLSAPFQRLIDDGSLTRLSLFDDVSTDVATIRYPPVLQFTPDLPAGYIAGESGIRAARVIIEANQGPAELDGADRRYVVEDCTATVQAIFGTPPVWYPQGPLIRRQLEDEGVSGAALGPTDLPGLLDPDDWRTDRAPLAGRRPVVGRYSRDHAHKWPDTWELTLATYGSPSFDFVSMGGHEAVDQVREEAPVPPTWRLLDYNEVAPLEFLAGIDFFAYFHHSRYVEAFGRAIAEAMASGAVVILPPVFEPVFGEGAVYCEPTELEAVVLRLAGDPRAYAAQAEAGIAYAARNFGYESYAATMQALRVGR